MLGIRFGAHPPDEFNKVMGGLVLGLHVTTSRGIASEMSAIIRRWLAAIQNGHPGFGVQTYCHLLLHAPELCIRHGGFAIYSCAGIEAFHQTVKPDLTRHRSGRLKFEDLTGSLLLRALWRSDEGIRLKIEEIRNCMRK